MRFLLKSFLILLVLASAGWVAVSVPVMGQTPYVHFRDAGGEQALTNAWGYAGEELKRTSDYLRKNAWPVVRGWVLSTEEWIRTGKPARGDEAEEQSEIVIRGPPSLEGPVQRSEVFSPAKERTNVDFRLRTEDKRDLDAKLASRLSGSN